MFSYGRPSPMVVVHSSKDRWTDWLKPVCIWPFSPAMPVLALRSPSAIFKLVSERALIWRIIEKYPKNQAEEIANIVTTANIERFRFVALSIYDKTNKLEGLF